MSYRFSNTRRQREATMQRVEAIRDTQRLQAAIRAFMAEVRRVIQVKP